MIKAIIYQELTNASRLMENANSVGTRAKTVYYKAIYTGLAGVVEAILYMIVKDSCIKNPGLLGNPKKTTDKRIHNLPSAALGSSKDLFVVERIKEPFTFKEVSSKFADLNKFCKQQGLISQRLFRKVDRIREKRNYVHLQLRTSLSRSYTKAQINNISDTIVELYNIWQAI